MQLNKPMKSGGRFSGKSSPTIEVTLGFSEEIMTDKLKILVVDDDPEWRKELDSLLSSADYKVETASSFQLARDKLLTATYAAIIIDLELEPSEAPQTFEGFGLLDGIQFLEELPRRQGKVIVLSAYGTIEHMRQAFKRGAYDFIQKQGFDKDKFLGIVREAVEQWRSSRAGMPQRELTPEEKKEYDRVTRQFLQGQPIQFDVPDDAVNPWEE
jgi:DNA-binding NtrC family response regulator